MLNFEEFFAKKKIDLVKLQFAEPGLFAEFSAHYPLMGEKSFDHTKKYWFNNLRRSYPLAAEIKPHAVKAEAISAMAVQGMAAAAAQNLNDAIERPKFNKDNLSGLVEENVSVKEVSLAEEEKTITENEVEKSREKKSEEQELTTSKPAFKPRFNIQNIKKDVVKEVSETEAWTSETEAQTNPEPVTENLQPETKPAKPAFKPRFNMQNIKKDVVKEASEMEAKAPEVKNIEPATESAKPAFKPRFNMQNIKKDVVKTVLETENKEPEFVAEANAELPTENLQPKTEEAKPVYKPRFQMKNMPKPTAENLPPATESE